MKLLSKLVFWIFGWKIKGGLPEGAKRYVVIVGPHTSAWDVVFGVAAIYLFDLPVRFLAKQEAFKPPFGFLLKAWGGIPIDRFSNNNVVDQVVKMFEENEEFILALSPEGTRSKVHEFRKGFYYMALGAKVPIVMGYLDFKNKIAGIGPIIHPTGNYEEDEKIIRTFYSAIEGKHIDKGIN